jgi:hypothetical protein
VVPFLVGKRQRPSRVGGWGRRGHRRSNALSLLSGYE